VRQDTAAAGELLVDSVIRLIEDQEIASTLILPTLVVRASCGSQLPRK
jgi:DNA-binding LacI/PurR family transcriptional regulator